MITAKEALGIAAKNDPLILWRELEDIERCIKSRAVSGKYAVKLAVSPLNVSQLRSNGFSVVACGYDDDDCEIYMIGWGRLVVYGNRD